MTILFILILLTAHYDTTQKTPGADDNLSAVSVILEAARILSKVNEPLNVRVIGFTLEELSPQCVNKTHVAAQELGLMDDNFNFKSLQTQTFWKKYISYVRAGRINYSLSLCIKNTLGLGLGP